MTAVAAPFGLKPSYHPSGVIRPDKGSIASGYASNIFQGSPVAYVATGGLALAAAGAKAAGVFQGVEYNTPANGGTRVISNFWPAATVATNVLAYLTTDPEIIFEIQANATLAETAIGRAYDWSANASANGNTFTGNSTVSLDVASVAPGGAGLIVIGLLEAQDNVWGDAFPVVLVKLAEPQFGGSILPAY
jgi:hypothetical protein